MAATEQRKAATEQRKIVRVQAGAADRAPRRVKVGQLLLRAILRALFDVRVVGLENVPRTPVIVCANHLGWVDPFMILLLLPVEPRLYVLGERAGVLRNNFRIRVIDFFQVMVPLDRKQPREALRVMLDTLRRGGSLIIFPEGHLGTWEGALQPLQPGAAQLSAHSGVLLLPIGLTGTSELWLRRRLTMRIGQPIDPAAFDGSGRARLDALTGALDISLRTLLPGDGQPAPRRKLLRDRLTNLL